jgi:hypothetical protein
MTAPRRRIVRPANPAAPDIQRQIRLQKLRASLERERAALARWMARLKRAFHAVEKAQQRSSRLERQITKMEEPNAQDHRSGRLANGRNDRADEGLRRR